jgi:hypothetical protein
MQARLGEGPGHSGMTHERRRFAGTTCRRAANPALPTSRHDEIHLTAHAGSGAHCVELTFLVSSSSGPVYLQPGFSSLLSLISRGVAAF